MLSYRWLKRLILWIPTITIGLWEYIRHAFLLPYVTMELGNLLAPFIVLAVTVTLLRGLFAKLEETQEALQRERLLKTALEEREQLARELHDGISQSLFLLSVKLDKLDQAESAMDSPAVRSSTASIRETVRRVYDDVRQSIANLRAAPVSTDKTWTQTLEKVASELEDSGLRVELDWRLPDQLLSAKQKVELLAIVREALQNVRKHADASLVRVTGVSTADGSGFRCRIEDDGIGARAERLYAKGCYGVRMMESRAAEMGWTLAFMAGADGGTIVELTREGRQSVDGSIA